jgi:hypothetical protein
MNTRTDKAARSGSYSLRIADERGDTCQRLVQTLPCNSVRALRVEKVEFSAWVRSSDAYARGSLVIADGEGRSTQTFRADDGWRLQRVIHDMTPGATSPRLVLCTSARGSHEKSELLFDDVSLRANRGPKHNLVSNGSAESPDLRVWRRLADMTPHFSVSRLLDGRRYSSDSFRRYTLYALLTFAGFWANFGWLTVPLDPIWYALLAVLCVVLAVALGLWANDTLTEWKQGKGSLLTWQKRSLFLLAAGLCLILLQTFLPMIGRDWQPQGRYLFPAIVPIATLLSLGWRRIHGRWGGDLSLTAWVTLLFLLHVLCVFRYVIPHYYG